MDIKILKKLTLELFGIIFSICFFSNSGYSLVLLRHQNVPEVIYKKYLTNNPEFINYKDYFISEHDYLQYDLIKLFFEAESELNPTKQTILIDNLFKELSSSLITEQIKLLWIETLRLDYLNNKTDTKIKLTYAEQIKSIQNKNILYEQPKGNDSFQLTDLNIKLEDDFYLNGWKILPEERSKIFLNKKLSYHFLILSNAMTPFIKIGKPMDLIINRIPLITGNCDQAVFLIPTEKNNKQKITALFDKDCINTQTVAPKDLNDPQIEKFPNTNNYFKPSWRSSPYSYGVLVVGIALLANYSELKNYRIRITLPF
jgi:hypothetical protein